jgi:hypothetical protein
MQGLHAVARLAALHAPPACSRVMARPDFPFDQDLNLEKSVDQTNGA